MSYNIGSSGSPYYNPYLSQMQGKPLNPVPTNTGMAFDDNNVTTSTVAQDQNNSAPEVQAQVQPLQQHYYTDPTLVNYNSVTTITGISEIMSKIEPRKLHLCSFGSKGKFKFDLKGEIFEELIPVLADLKMSFQPQMTELLKLHYQVELARAEGQSTHEIACLEEKQIEILKTLDLKLKFSEGNRSDTPHLRCCTWLHKSLVNDKKLVIPPYCIFVVQPKLHVMMYSVPEGYLFEDYDIKVLLGDKGFDIPFNFDTKNIITMGRPFKFIIVVKIEEEIKENEEEIKGNELENILLTVTEYIDEI